MTAFFERLRAIAKENNVSYGDLCVYAVGTGEGEKEKDKK